MSWDSVGSWIKNNAGKGAALVGSLLTGNLPGAIAAGVAMVSSATGTDDPTKALEALQTDPASLIKLRELAYESEADIRHHIAEMKRLELEDVQKQHAETQATIRAGDKAQDRFVRWTRPGQSWLSLGAAFAYVFTAATPDVTILGLLLTLPWAYAGLRQLGKGVDAVADASVARKK